MRYFKIEEFESRYEKGSGAKMDKAFLTILDNIRHDCGFPFVITSAYRTPQHNKDVGGAINSAHLRGHAVDVRCTDGAQRLAIVQNAIKHGIKRIGIAKNFVHLDNDPTLTNSLWLY
jgi:zinc D-Ala-D-Ala carboxypeptidase